MQEKNEEVYNKLMSSMLISLYQSNLNKEKESDIMSLYSYLNDKEIHKETKKYLNIIGENNDMFLSVGYDLSQRLSIDVFTNPDLKNKEYTAVLLHNVYCDSDSFYEKMEKLLTMQDTNIFINFKNLDSAPQEVLNYVEKLSKEEFNNILFNFDNASKLNLNAEAVYNTTLKNNYKPT